MDKEVKRLTARTKSGLAMEFTQGETTMAETNRQSDLKPSEVEEWGW